MRYSPTSSAIAYTVKACASRVPYYLRFYDTQPNVVSCGLPENRIQRTVPQSLLSGLQSNAGFLSYYRVGPLLDTPHRLKTTKISARIRVKPEIIYIISGQTLIKSLRPRHKLLKHVNIQNVNGSREMFCAYLNLPHSCTCALPIMLIPGIFECVIARYKDSPVFFFLYTYV